MAEERRTEARQFPGAEMSGEQKQAAVHLRLRVFKVLEAVRLDHFFQLVERTRGKLAEESELPAEAVEALAQQFFSLGFRLLGKRQTQGCSSGFSQVCGERVSEFTEAAAEFHRRGSRQTAEGDEDGSDGRILQKWS